MIAITFAGVDMNSGTPDADGALWYVTAWEGWDSPNLRQSVLDPSLRDGGIITDSIFGTRTITLSGVCKAGSESVYWTAYNRCNSLVGANNEVDLVVSENVDKRVSVRRAGSPKIRSIGMGSFEWDWPLIAMDPRKYAVTETSVVIAAGATVTATNNGNAITYPILTVGSGNLVVENDETGLVLSTAATSSPHVPSGTVFDMLNRTAYSGSTSYFHRVNPLAAWWGLVPGTNDIINTGTNSITMTYHDAWV